MFKWIRRLFRRSPNFVIGQPDRPYILRWYLIPQNRLFNIYLHKVLRSDDDRALHDHPWASVSVMVAGSYLEVTPQGSRVFRAGSIIFRRASHTHRLELIGSRPCWTLFITGPKVREWGFHCPKGWVHWRDFVEPTNHGNVGKGCAE